MIRDAEPADVDTILAFWQGAGADPSVTDVGASVLTAMRRLPSRSGGRPVSNLMSGSRVS